jgi:hypothetical protein
VSSAPHVFLAALAAFMLSGGASVDDGHDTLLAWQHQTTVGQAIDGGATRALIRYEWIDTPAQPGLGNGVLCNATGANDTSGWGTIRLLQAFDRASGLPLGPPERRCVKLSAEPPPLPAPPTAGDAWRLVHMGAPPIHVTPPGRGVTGFETRLWTVAPARVSADAQVGVFSVHAFARPVGYQIDWGDGTTSSSMGAGDRDHPIARHVYERAVDYEITVRAVWSANARFSGPGIDPRPIDIGRATTSTTARYAVDEVRSVLISP